MKITRLHRKNDQTGSAMLSVMILMLVIISGIAALASYVSATVQMADRRTDMITAIQFSQGGAAIGADDLNRALTNNTAALFVNLVGNSVAYSVRTDLGNALQKVFEKKVASPFSNQTVNVQIWMTNSTTPTKATIKCTAVVGKVTHTSQLNVNMVFGFGAAIISDSPGSSSTTPDKSAGLAGNVAVNGSSSGITVVDGGAGLAIWANGHANVDTLATVPAAAVLQSCFNTANKIPDYTLDGSTDQLFDFNRFKAASDVMGTHYTNLNNFFTNLNNAMASPAGALEGIIVVDIKKTDPYIGDFNATKMPNGIKVRGTLIFNFSSEYSPTDKLINTNKMEINPADMTGFDATKPSTYKTGYPPTFTNPARKASNVDITSKGFPNFNPSDDLPALMYNIGILDIHGQANICGVMYSPSYSEIENKYNNQIQYFKGSIIVGGGVYYENLKNSKSVISYDPLALDLLATSATKGKRVVATNWE